MRDPSDVHIYLHVDSTAADGTVKQLLTQLIAGQEKIMALIDDVQADVAAQTTVVGSVVTLLQNLSAQIAAAGTDPVKLQAIKDSLDQNTAALAAAVVANTPPTP